MDAKYNCIIIILAVAGLLQLTACGHEESPQNDPESGKDSLTVENQQVATEGKVTGSNVIIRSDHSTESQSAGVVAKEGTIVQILDQFNTGNSNEAILKRDITITKNGNSILLSGGKAMRIIEDRNDSVRASFSTANYGATEATISKNNIEAIGGEKWYKIQTNDDITGWIYGKFIEEM